MENMSIKSKTDSPQLSVSDHSKSSHPSQRKTESTWYCHCCTAQNTSDRDKCRVCGRLESYVQQGYPLPYHGKNAKIFRPSHVLTVLESVHEVDSEKMTSLHSACANGNAAIVKELLRFKSKTDVLTKKGHTPLHLAVYSGSFECVAELVKYKADVNVLTKSERNSPLHIACEKGFGKISEFLIKSGADVHSLNVLQRTPLHQAAMLGRTDIGQLLLRSGANALALDAHAWEPRQIAELSNNRLFQELMIREGMGEKQSVIKELPPAKWHGKLWDGLTRMQDKKTIDHAKQLKLEHDLERHRQDIEVEKVQRVKAAIRVERRHELELQRIRLEELQSKLPPLEYRKKDTTSLASVGATFQSTV
jgi:hypothetical protein